jgi:hypothetical protein
VPSKTGEFWEKAGDFTAQIQVALWQSVAEVQIAEK